MSYKILPHNTAKQHIVSTKYSYHVSLETDGRERKPGSCARRLRLPQLVRMAINFLQLFCQARQHLFYMNTPSTCKLLDTAAGGRYNG